MTTRWMRRAAVLLAAAAAAAAQADSRGRLISVTDKWETSETGERIGVIRVEAQRAREPDLSRLRIRLEVQVKDASGKVLFGSLLSHGIGAWTRGGGNVVNHAWIFTFKPGTLDNPRLSYAVTLLDAVSESVTDRRDRAIPKREAWDKENQDASPLFLRQIMPLAKGF